MPINATSLFSTAASSAMGYWKSVSSTTAGAAVDADKTGKADKADNVSMSKLGQALTGQAAELFKHLDPKARGMLENFVNTGKASADDVVSALSGYAAFAVQGRFNKETPLDAKETALVQKRLEIEKYEKSASDVRQGILGNKRNQLAEVAPDGGMAALESFGKFTGLLKEADAAAEAIKPVGMTSVNADLAKISDSLMASRAEKFFASGLGKQENGRSVVVNSSELAAMSKLGDLGWSPMGDSLRDYAGGVDLSGLTHNASALSFK